MRIDNKINYKVNIPFESIEIGDTFEYKEELYIRTITIDNINALCLNDNEFEEFYSDTLVIPRSDLILTSIREE